MLNLRKELIGGIFHFVEAGTMIDDGQGGQVAVSATVKPAAALDVWSNMGEIQSMIPDKDVQTDSVTGFNANTSKYVTTTEDIVTADYMDWVLLDHSELIWRMVFGIDGKIPADGTAVIPFNTNIRTIEGWSQVVGRSAKDKQDRVLMDVYIEMKVKAYPGFQNQTTLPEIRTKALPSDLNTSVFDTTI